MAETPGTKHNKNKRDRAVTEQVILDAFEHVMVRDGVKGLGVNAVASEAGVNKVLIYRYFDDFPGLAKRWAELSDIWPSALEIIGNDPEAFAQLDVRTQIITALGNYMDAIRRRPLTIELLAAELCFPGEITRVLEMAMAKPGSEIRNYTKVNLENKELLEKLGDLIIVVNAVTAYMTIREKNNPEYLGVRLDDASWQRLRSTIDLIAEKYLAD